MKKLFSLLTFSFLALALVVPSSVFGAQHQWFTADPSTAWRGVASDADGSHLIAGNSTNSIFISHDFGGTWSEHAVGPSGNGTRSVKSDSTGTNLLVGSGASGLLYRSEDSGETWDALDPSSGAVEYWTSIASDADGSNLAAVTSATSTIYTSLDGGDIWEEHTATSTQISLTAIASDADGSKLIAGTSNGFIYVSDDGGDTWVERRPAGDTGENWSQVASDADGSNLIVTGGSTLVYTSSDGGANWTERQPTGFPDEGWGSVASDDTGTNLLAGINGGRLYSSDDGGDTWFEEQPGGANSYAWQAVASDADGSNLTVATVEGGLYVTPAPIILDSFTPSDNATEVVVGINLTLVFNKDIATSTGDITIYKASDDSLVETIDVAGPKATLSDTTTLEIDLDADLEEATEYYVLIDAGAIEDDAGAPFSGISDETQWSFTTDAPPVVETFSPADDAENVSVAIFSAGTPTIVFDQDVVVGTGNITLKKVSDDSTVATFDVTDADALEAEDEYVYIYQSVNLEYATAYYLLIDEGALVDGTGNSFAGISDPTTWSFTTAPAPTFDFERISVSDEDEEGDGTSQNSKISNDGRYVVFESIATNLVTGDTNGTYDTFVYDRNLNTIERVSLNSEGGENVENVQASGISGDGRFVTFTTSGLLFPENIVGVNNIFVYDRDTQELEFVSKNEGGEEGDGDSIRSSISDDGRYVVFESDATNLVVGDINNRADIFVYDRDMDTITREVLFDDGDPYYMNGNDGELTVSGDGQHIVYVRFDENTFLTDIFLFDRESDTTEQIDVSSDEVSGDDSASFPAVSEDGRYVVFQSGATNLTADMVNGSGAVFLRDRTLGTTELIGSEYVLGNGYVSADGLVSISSDGRYVFYSASDEEGDNFHLYRYDREENIELLITEGVGIADGGASVLYPSVSDDGMIVSFYSSNTDLVTGDTNGSTDVFVWEEVIEEETPPVEEEDNGGSGGSHRRSGGGSSSNGDAALLESLWARVQELKAILASLLGSSSTTYTRDLDLNSEGPDVTALQLFLIAQNKGPHAQALAIVGATGLFGPLTQSTLAEFQASVGITPASGYFGPITRAYINGL